MVFALVPPSAEESEQWLQLLESPSDTARTSTTAVLVRAERLASTVPRRRAPLALDIVISGCGFKVNYFLGVHSILSRLAERGCLELHRYAGSSSGAKTPFHILLAGEALALDHHLAYGELCERRGGSTLHAAMRNDRSALVTIDHLLERFESELPKLDGKAHICIAQHTWRGPRRVTLSRFCDDSISIVKQRLREIWHATGTLITRVEGYGWCSDGGMADNAPVFSDQRRDQLLVQPQHHDGLPSSMVFAYTREEAMDAIAKGQDDAVKFLMSSQLDVLPSSDDGRTGTVAEAGNIPRATLSLVRASASSRMYVM